MTTSANAIRRRLRRWAYENETFIRKGRRKRMLDMVSLLGIRPGARIVDLGGTEYVWSLFEHDFHVTLVNMVDIGAPSDPERFTTVQADACNLADVFEDGQFDLAFSNSTIEHVGGESEMRSFAREIQRVGKSYWVQTPSRSFPIEAHSGIPYYWYLPACLQRYHGSHQVTVLTRGQLESYLPGSERYIERVGGFVKSYAAYRRLEPGPAAD